MMMAMDRFNPAHRNVLSSIPDEMPGIQHRDTGERCTERATVAKLVEKNARRTQSTATDKRYPWTVVFSGMADNGEHAPNILTQIQQYVQEIKSSKDAMSEEIHVRLHLYASGGQPHVLRDAIGQFNFTEVSVDIIDEFCIPSTDHGTAGVMWPKANWPTGNQISCPLNTKACRRAYLRERLRAHALESLIMSSKGHVDLAEVVLVHFDSEAFLLPSPQSVLAVINRVRSKSDRIGAVFSNGAEHNGPAGGRSYDSFTLVDKSGRWKQPQRFTENTDEWMAQMSGFGGLTVFNGQAYWHPSCSYSSHHQDTISNYIPSGKHAIRTQVDGWPNEHLNIHICLSAHGFKNWIAPDLKAVRASNQWRTRVHSGINTLILIKSMPSGDI